MGLWILAVLILLVLMACLVAAYAIAGMPGSSHAGPLPPLTADETALSDRLRTHVRKLAGDRGERNVLIPQALEAAAQYIESSLSGAGYAPLRQAYRSAGNRPADYERTVVFVLAGFSLQTANGTARVRDRAYEPAT